MHMGQRVFETILSIPDFLVELLEGRIVRIGNATLALDPIDGTLIRIESFRTARKDRETDPSFSQQGAEN